MTSGIKDEMQKILTGWGIWLETCEILDVKITSQSLFENFQTQFKEDERMKAEKIVADTNNTTNEENLIRTTEFTKKKAESDSMTQNDQLKK